MTAVGPARQGNDVLLASAQTFSASRDTRPESSLRPRRRHARRRRGSLGLARRAVTEDPEAKTAGAFDVVEHGLEAVPKVKGRVALRERLQEDGLSGRVRAAQAVREQHRSQAAALTVRLDA